MQTDLHFLSTRAMAYADADSHPVRLIVLVIGQCTLFLQSNHCLLAQMHGSASAMSASLERCASRLPFLRTVSSLNNNDDDPPPPRRVLQPLPLLPTPPPLALSPPPGSLLPLPYPHLLQPHRSSFSKGINERLDDFFLPFLQLERRVRSSEEG